MDGMQEKDHYKKIKERPEILSDGLYLINNSSFI